MGNDVGEGRREQEGGTRVNNKDKAEKRKGREDMLGKKKGRKGKP